MSQRKYKETIKYENKNYYLLQSDNEECCCYWIEISESIFNQLKDQGAFIFGMEELKFDKEQKKIWLI